MNRLKQFALWYTTNLVTGNEVKLMIYGAGILIIGIILFFLSVTVFSTLIFTVGFPISLICIFGGGNALEYGIKRYCDL